MPDEALIALVIAVLSVVQSIFGMGLLVFGTPTLLLMGLPFAEILTYLLPSSMALSALQVVAGGVWREQDGGKPDLRGLFVFCLPSILIGLGAALSGRVELRIDVVIGVMLIASALIRSIAPIREALFRVIRAHRRPYLVAMGLVHGLSNMGGALLAVYAASVHADKQGIRNTVSSYYLFFGAVQLGLVLLLGRSDLTPAKLAFVPVAVAVYALVGSRLYRMASEGVYQTLITGLTAAYGATILIRLQMG